jgi:hypothetical protein
MPYIVPYVKLLRQERTVIPIPEMKRFRMKSNGYDQTRTFFLIRSSGRQMTFQTVTAESIAVVTSWKLIFLYAPRKEPYGAP